MLSRVTSATVTGIDSFIVQVETDLSNGIPYFAMTGYVGTQVKEAGERVRTALKNIGHRVPSARIVVNISPAGFHKSGTMFDLPVAVGLLCDMEEISTEELSQTMIVGELSLDGRINGINGILSMVARARKEGIKRVIVPADNQYEAGLIEGVEVIGVSELSEVLAALRENNYEKYKYRGRKQPYLHCGTDKNNDFSRIAGQYTAKRAALIAAAGRHNLLLSGAPGSGKTMIAGSIPTILPELTKEEYLEVMKIYSVSGLLGEVENTLGCRPFRAPHHTVSQSALLGGGSYPLPGEITLAHNGVLFLGGYFCKTAETPNLRALWRFSYLEFFKKSAKTILHTTFWNCVLPLFDCFFAERFMVADYLMAKPYTIWQKEETKWRNYTRMAKGEGAYGI